MKFDLKKHFNKKKVLITGHTGFKGSWLTLWLHNYGAKIMGISANIPTSPNHFSKLKLNKNIINRKCNIKNYYKTFKIINNFKPDYIFHFAAQSIVSHSYINPLETWNTNTLGTINILESVRKLKNKCNVIIITSDKSYRNFEVLRGYKETDILGGNDPYGASKAAAEISIKSYFESFLKEKPNLRLAIARAGNVVGGGDWTPNRLIPDCVKNWSKNKKPFIRNPNSTRPWQHVLEVIYGYLLLSINLKNNKKINGEAFNFGPKNQNDYSVNSVLLIARKNWNQASWKFNKKSKFKESKLLKLNSQKSKKKLSWNCILGFKDTINLTINWYKLYYSNKGKNVKNISIKDLNFYKKKLNIN